MKTLILSFTLVPISLVLSCSEASNRRLTVSNPESAEQITVRQIAKATATPAPTSTSTSNPLPTPTPTSTPSATPTPSPSTVAASGCAPVILLLNEAFAASGLLSSGMNNCMVDSDCRYLPSALRCTASVCSTGCGIALNHTYLGAHQTYLGHPSYIAAQQLLLSSLGTCAYAVPSCFAAQQVPRCVEQKCALDLGMLK